MTQPPFIRARFPATPGTPGWRGSLAGPGPGQRFSPWALTLAAGLLASLLLGFPAPQSPAQEPATPAVADGNSTQARRVARAVDVVQQWLPHQHLYVKGNLGLGDDRLSDLERWLDEHAAHWTVVLTESAQDERFTDATGESFAGMDAVEQALGKGLPNQTAFGQWTNPHTGERNGAFFVLFLQERQFSYYGSDAQDRRGLGEDHWAGQLDGSAIAAMRGGGRIVDAVKDTVTLIDHQLTDAIAREERQRQRRTADEEASREQARVQAASSRQAAAAAVALLSEEAAGLLLAQPQLMGDIPRPDTAALQADLAAAQSAFDTRDFAAAKTLAEGVRAKAQAGLRAVAGYPQDAGAIASLRMALDEAAPRPRPAAIGSAANTAGAALDAVRQAYDRGDSAYLERLASARQQVAAVTAQAQATVRAAERRRQLALAAAAAAGLGALAVGLFLNLRRRPSRREAWSLLDAWTRALDEKTDALFTLLDRAHTLVGSSGTDAGRRFTGRTLELSQQIIRDVDELIIMSACAQRLLQGARDLAMPTGAGGRCANLFSRRRYRAAVRRLHDEPIAFQPEEGLELVVRGRKSARDTLLGSLESYQPFALSFSQLMAAFQERAERSLANLERVEGCLSHVPGAVEAIHERLRLAQAAEAELPAAAAPEARFGLGPVFAELLPAAAADADEAARVAIRDPVGALEIPAATADQRTADALALVQLAQDYQGRVHPRLQEMAQQLGRVPLGTDWLAAAVGALSAQADALALQALRASAGQGIAALRADLEALVERAARVLALDQVRRETVLPAVTATDALVSTARDELAGPLGLKPEIILREPGQDPSECLVQAREQLAGVKAALERGDVAGAEAGLAAANQRVGEAGALVQATRQAFAAHTGTLTARRQETERLQQALPEHQRILVDIQAGYAPAVLLLGQGDPAHPNANGTVQDNLKEAHEATAAGRERTDQAEVAFRAGGLLLAASLLEQAAGCQAQADARLQEIAEKQRRLRDTEAANEALSAQLASQLQALAPSVQDARTRQVTLQAFDSARQRFAQAEAWRSAPPRDPFRVADELAAVAQSMAAAAEQVRCDWGLHAEAERSLQAATAQLEVARRLGQAAGADAVADSPAIRQAAGPELNACAAALDQAQRGMLAPHGDWLEVDAAADRAALEAGRVAAALRDELAAAQVALSALSLAAARVRAATGWGGGLGVSIGGSPGADLLDQARSALQGGDYRGATRCAESARRLADTAIAEAEVEAQRRRRAAEEQRARERREREAAEESRRRAASFPTFGGSGVGRSSFPSSSGVSRSSFGSSSGVRRSGW